MDFRAELGCSQQQQGSRALQSQGERGETKDKWEGERGKEAEAEREADREKGRQCVLLSSEGHPARVQTQWL